jgi:hypothetical protein
MFFFKASKSQINKVLIPEATHWQTESLIVGFCTHCRYRKPGCGTRRWSIVLRRTPPITEVANVVERPICCRDTLPQDL